VARIEPSNTATGEASSGRPRSITLAKWRGLWRVVQIVEARTDSDSIRRQPRHQSDNLVKVPLGLDVHDPDLQIG